MHVIVIGNPLEGFVIIGPFTDYATAADYAENENDWGADYWLMPLERSGDTLDYKSK